MTGLLTESILGMTPHQPPHLQTLKQFIPYWNIYLPGYVIRIYDDSIVGLYGEFNFDRQSIHKSLCLFLEIIYFTIDFRILDNKKKLGFYFVDLSSCFLRDLE